MKTEKELNADILEVTMQIHAIYPELSKYLEELTITIPNKVNPTINTAVLQEYYDSLNCLFKKYTINHNTLNQNIAFNLMNFYSVYVL